MCKKIIFAIITVFIMISCDTEEIFITHESGLRYRLVTEGDGATAKKGDILVLDMKYSNDKDSLLFDSKELDRQFRTQLKERTHKGGCIEDAMGLLKIGDSIRFKINARLYFEETRNMDIPKGIDPESDITFAIKLRGIQTYTQIESERKALKHYNADEEEKVLAHYLEITNTQVEPSGSGLYYINEREGTGAQAEAGKTVVINYTGSLIDGTVFDTSYNRKGAFKFVLGIGDVIIGMEEGVSKMKVGGKSKLIIPSHLAYGEKGFSYLDKNNRRKEVIAPFSTLIFEIELLAIE